jgi:hypothetical protein
MTHPTDRLRLAPDVQSEHRPAGQGADIGTAPQYPGCVNNRYGAGPTLNSDEGADMEQSTRGRDPVDRWTRDPGVNITPLARSGPVTTTPSAA